MSLVPGYPGFIPGYPQIPNTKYQGSSKDWCWLTWLQWLFKFDLCFQRWLTNIIDNIHHHQHENKSVMKAGMKKTKCLLPIAGKGRICPSSSERDNSLVPSLKTIGKRWLWRRKNCQLDWKKGSVHVKSRDDSWWMNSSEESQHYQISSWPY